MALISTGFMIGSFIWCRSVSVHLVISIFNLLLNLAALIIIISFKEK